MMDDSDCFEHALFELIDSKPLPFRKVDYWIYKPMFNKHDIGVVNKVIPRLTENKYIEFGGNFQYIICGPRYSQWKKDMENDKVKSFQGLSIGKIEGPAHFGTGNIGISTSGDGHLDKSTEDLASNRAEDKLVGAVFRVIKAIWKHFIG